MTYGPLRHYTGGVLDGTVVDPRFGVGATPTQPSGWGGGGGTVSGALVSVDGHGAVADGRDIFGTLMIVASSVTVTGPSGTFSAADIGKIVWLLSHGIAANWHRTTITAATSTTVTLAAAPTFSDNAGTAIIGTDNSTAINAAITAAMAYGQAGVQFGPGLYLTEQPLTALTYTRDFRLSGASGGGMSYGLFTNMDPSPGTELRYMGAGAGYFLDAGYTRGFSLTDIAVRYANPSYTAKLVSLDNTWTSHFQRFLIGGVWNARAATLVYDPRTIEAEFTDGVFERAAMGFDTGAGYNNAGTWSRVVWLACDVALNGTRRQATFLGCVWEPTGGNLTMTGDPITNPSPVQGQLEGATFVGCGWWDAQNAGGDGWIRPDAGSTVAIFGGYFEPRTAVEVLVKVNTAILALTIHGLHSEGFGSTGARVVALGASGSVPALDYRGNTHNSAVVSGIDAITSGVALEADTGFHRVVALGSVPSAVTLRSTGMQTVTLTGNAALTMPTLPVGSAMTLSLLIVQDATGGRTPTWPASVKWSGGGLPALNTAANASSLVRLTTLNGGTTWLGRLEGTWA